MALDMLSLNLTVMSNAQFLVSSIYSFGKTISYSSPPPLPIPGLIMQRRTQIEIRQDSLLNASRLAGNG